MWSPPVRQRLEDGRQHFSHGPIDLVIGVDGPPAAVDTALETAWSRFRSVLVELVDELPLLRRAFDPSTRFEGKVARRMQDAVRPFAADTFITPMAAVAGAVADEICAVIATAGSFDRIHVNNGGDIAVRLAAGRSMRIGMAPDNVDAGRRPAVTDTIVLRSGDSIGGIATSGRHGRSFSLGIADAVTVLGADAAAADAAATLIANAVDIASPRVIRAPACSLDPDSDLGERAVTVDVEPLTAAEAAKALDGGEARAHNYLRRGLVRGAALYLQSTSRVVGVPGLLLQPPGTDARAARLSAVAPRASSGGEIRLRPTTSMRSFSRTRESHP